MIIEKNIRQDDFITKVYSELLSISEVTELWGDAVSQDVFNHPIWYQEAYNHLILTERVICLDVITVRQNGQLVAYWPMWQRRGTFRDLWAKIAEPIGTKFADYTHPLIRKGTDITSITTEFTEKIEDLAKSGCIVLLPKIPYPIVFSDKFNKDICSNSTNKIVSRFEFSETYDLTIKKLKKNHRGDINRQIRRLEKLGRLELVCYSKTDEIKKKLPELYNMHIQEWNKRGLYSQFSNAAVKNFFFGIASIDSIPHYSEVKIIDSGEVISAHIGFISNNWLYWYKPTYNINYQNYSPGKVHLALLTKYGIDKDWKGIDMLQGQETYKSLWSNNTIISEWSIISNSCNNIHYIWCVRLRERAKDIYIHYRNKLMNNYYKRY